MTAFAILGSSGLAYQRGIGVYGLMASSSGFVIPLTLLFVGTRLWALGKRFGHITQVQYLRDRWECSHIGTVIFALTAAMLVPYIVIGVMGGGHTLETVSEGFIPYWLGGLIVAIVVMSYVFFGGMRGTAWVNTLQTIMFLTFGTIAFLLISRQIGGFDEIMSKLATNPKTQSLLTRQRIPMEEFFSYTLIPLSAIMFPHISIMCMTAERVTHFRKTVVFYPICIMLIWLPSVLLGIVASVEFPGLKPGESDNVILRLLASHTDAWLAGVLGAAIMACVMATDSQILALSTMFTQDVFAHYGGQKRFGEKVQVWTGRMFVVVVTVFAYFVALQLKDKAGIFELAIRFAFSGFAAMCPVMLAALFWRRSTKWGALASTLWVTATIIGIWYLHSTTASIAPKPGEPFTQIAPALGNLFVRSPGNVLVYNYLPVLPMVVGSAIAMVLVSCMTKTPSQATIDRYFSVSSVSQ